MPLLNPRLLPPAPLNPKPLCPSSASLLSPHSLSRRPSATTRTCTSTRYRSSRGMSAIAAPSPTPRYISSGGAGVRVAAAAAHAAATALARSSALATSSTASRARCVTARGGRGSGGGNNAKAPPGSSVLLSSDAPWPFAGSAADSSASASTCCSPACARSGGCGGSAPASPAEPSALSPCCGGASASAFDSEGLGRASGGIGIAPMRRDMALPPPPRLPSRLLPDFRLEPRGFCGSVGPRPGDAIRNSSRDSSSLPMRWSTRDATLAEPGGKPPPAPTAWRLFDADVEAAAAEGRRPVLRHHGSDAGQLPNVAAAAAKPEAGSHLLQRAVEAADAAGGRGWPAAGPPGAAPTAAAAQPGLAGNRTQLLRKLVFVFGRLSNWHTCAPGHVQHVHPPTKATGTTTAAAAVGDAGARAAAAAAAAAAALLMPGRDGNCKGCCRAAACVLGGWPVLLTVLLAGLGNRPRARGGVMLAGLGNRPRARGDVMLAGLGNRPRARAALLDRLGDGAWQRIEHCHAPVRLPTAVKCGVSARRPRRWPCAGAAAQAGEASTRARLLRRRAAERRRRKRLVVAHDESRRARDCLGGARARGSSGRAAAAAAAATTAAAQATTPKR
eukprot:365741-Chlamydomonas_euryale.AAC.10